MFPGPGVAGLDVTDPGFDIDAAIDASAGVADSSIAGAAGNILRLPFKEREKRSQINMRRYFSGSFDVDSTLDFDLDHITAVGGLPPDVTSGADLLTVSGLGAGDGSVDMDIPGTSQSKI